MLHLSPAAAFSALTLATGALLAAVVLALAVVAVVIVVSDRSR